MGARRSSQQMDIKNNSMQSIKHRPSSLTLSQLSQFTPAWHHLHTFFVYSFFSPLYRLLSTLGPADSCRCAKRVVKAHFVQQNLLHVEKCEDFKFKTHVVDGGGRSTISRSLQTSYLDLSHNLTDASINTGGKSHTIQTLDCRLSTVSVCACVRVWQIKWGGNEGQNWKQKTRSKRLDPTTQMLYAVIVADHDEYSKYLA